MSKNEQSNKIVTLTRIGKQKRGILFRINALKIKF